MFNFNNVESRLLLDPEPAKTGTPSQHWLPLCGFLIYKMLIEAYLSFFPEMLTCVLARIQFLPSGDRKQKIDRSAYAVLRIRRRIQRVQINKFKVHSIVF